MPSDPRKPLLVEHWGRVLKRRPPKRVAKPITLRMHELALPKAAREAPGSRSTNAPDASN